MRTGADALAHGLMDAGVQYVFGLPGDTGVDLYDAFYRVAPSLRHVLCRDERHAAVMADVYARCRNTVGVIEISSGGGATYCVGGLGEPFAASVPLLVISSDIHAGSRGTGALTELDQEALFGAVTKWVRRARHAEEIPSLLIQALGEATSDRPAPVALIVPENVLAERIPEDAVRANPASHAPFPVTDPDLLAALASALIQAERPAIVAGGGVHWSEAYAELDRLAELASVPVATTIHGKGAYPETAPWSLGVVGANGGRPYANEYLQHADFVVFVGTRANATDTNSYRCPPRSARVAQIDIDSERAGRNYPGSLRVVADARHTLAELIKRVGSQGNGRAELRRTLEARRRAWCSTSIPEVAEGAVHPLAVFETLRVGFGSDALVVADCGTATPFLAAHWQITVPGRRVLMARGHGPMGYAIPGAIGAALANEGKPIVAITTDGSFNMACGELETVTRLQLPITFVQLTNGSYGWIKMLQHLYHDRRYFGVDIPRVDAPAVARGFGVPALRVRSQPELEQALHDCRARSGPLFIEVTIPELMELAPPVAPWTAALDGTDTTRPVY